MAEPRVVDVPLPTHTARVLEWGPADGPLVVALHGFPDTAWTWRHVGPLLARRGYRVAAPFLRGYGPSAVPTDDVYTVGALMADAVGVHAALGGDERSVVLGHDWGAITASGLGAHPDSPFRRVVALAVPPLPLLHPGRGVLAPWLGAVVRQPAKSWYIVANQVPGLSERTFERLVTKLWRDWSPGYDARDDVAHVLAAVPDPTHARAVVSYYRAVLRPGRRASAYARWARTWTAAPVVPTLYLHGTRDGCLDRRFFDVVEPRLAPPSRAALVPDAGHFLQVEQPHAVAEHVAAFLVASP